MECPKCGYVMDAFEIECPRCKRSETSGQQVTTPQPVRTPSLQPKSSGFEVARLMKIVNLTLSWFLGLLFLLMGLALLGEAIIPASMLVVISLLLLPPLRSFVHSRTNKELPVTVRAAAIFVLFIASMMLTPRHGQTLKEGYDDGTRSAEKTLQPEKKQVEKPKPASLQPVSAPHTKANPVSPWEYRHGGKSTGAPTSSRSSPRPSYSPQPTYQQTQPTYQAPTSVASGGYIGNASSKKFHRPTCNNLPAPGNQVALQSREQAIAQAFEPCKICNP